MEKDNKINKLPKKKLSKITIAILSTAIPVCSIGAGLGIAFGVKSCNDNAAIRSIEINTQPSKTSFAVGEVFNSNGLKLTATYTNDSKKTIESGFTTDYDDHKFEAAEIGTGKTVTVTYLEKTCTYTINVTAATLDRIEVESGTPTKTTFKVGEKFNSDGLIVKAIYTDGNTTEVTTGFTTSIEKDYQFKDSDIETGKKVKVTYSEKECYYAIDVTAATLQSIAIKTQPSTTTFNVGDKFNTDGLVLTLTYDTTTVDITNGYTIEGCEIGHTFTNDEQGTKPITLKYSDKTCTYNINVICNCVLLFIGSTPIKMTWAADVKDASTLSYKINDEAWTSAVYDTEISVPANAKLYLKGTLKTTQEIGGVGSGVGYIKIETQQTNEVGDVTLSGNLMNLIQDEEGNPATSIENYNYAFNGLFIGSTAIAKIESNILPATTLSEGCYEQMFNGCTNLKSIPENLLPATTLSKECYYGMFYGCTSLTTLPKKLLPAKSLVGKNNQPADCCYEQMFQGCTHLASIPENFLPAITLAPSCYHGMFIECDSLSNLPKLPGCKHMYNKGTEAAPDWIEKDGLSEKCYQTMFSGCKSLTTLPENLLPITTLAPNCYKQMFQSCTNLASIPENFLPAIDLTGAEHCYQSMFYECTSLTTTPNLPATTLADYCYHLMFYNCSGLMVSEDEPKVTYSSTGTIFTCPTTIPTDAVKEMFAECGELSPTTWVSGTTGTPSAKHAYYWYKK